MKASLAAVLVMLLAWNTAQPTHAQGRGTTAWSPIRKTPSQQNIWGEPERVDHPVTVRPSTAPLAAARVAPHPQVAPHPNVVHAPNVTHSTNVARVAAGSSFSAPVQAGRIQAATGHRTPVQPADFGHTIVEEMPEPIPAGPPTVHQQPVMVQSPVFAQEPIFAGSSVFASSPTFMAPGAGRRPFHAGVADGAACGLGWPTRGLFAELLYLRPGNDRVGYAVPIDGAIIAPGGVAPVQIGGEATVDLDFSSGYRIGGNLMINPLASIEVSYTQFDSDTHDSTSVNSPFVLRSLVAHPGTQSAATDFLQGSAQLEIAYDLIDFALTREIFAGPDHFVAWQMGARFASLEQTFGSELLSSTRQENVDTMIDFDGGGVTVGLRGARRVQGSYLGPAAGVQNLGWSLYGKALASFLAGNFETAYRQRDSFTAADLVNTGWEEDRVVPVLDLELGLCWTSRTERFHLSAGYMFSAWYNVVTTNSFIDAVQENASGSIDDTLTFDGLVINAEYKF